MELFALYDSEKDQWYKRGSWNDPGKKPKVWRERGPMKLAMLYEADMLGLTRGRLPDVKGMHWSEVRKLENELKVQGLPDTYHIYKFTDNGPAFVAIAKDWYKS